MSSGLRQAYAYRVPLGKLHSSPYSKVLRNAKTCHVRCTKRIKYGGLQFLVQELNFSFKQTNKKPYAVKALQKFALQYSIDINMFIAFSTTFVCQDINIEANSLEDIILINPSPCILGVFGSRREMSPVTIIQKLWHIKGSEGSAEMNMSELHLFFILRNRAYIHMHEALDAKYRQESKQRHLLKAQRHSLQFFPDFSNKAFLLQLLNTAAGSKRQGLYCDHPPNSDALAFCPNCKKKKNLPSIHLQYHHMAGQAAHVMLEQ